MWLSLAACRAISSSPQKPASKVEEGNTPLVTKIATLTIVGIITAIVFWLVHAVLSGQTSTGHKAKPESFREPVDSPGFFARLRTAFSFGGGDLDDDGNIAHPHGGGYLWLGGSSPGRRSPPASYTDLAAGQPVTVTLARSPLRPQPRRSAPRARLSAAGRLSVSRRDNGHPPSLSPSRSSLAPLAACDLLRPQGVRRRRHVRPPEPLPHVRGSGAPSFAREPAKHPQPVQQRTLPRARSQSRVWPLLAAPQSAAKGSSVSVELSKEVPTDGIGAIEARPPAGPQPPTAGDAMVSAGRTGIRP